MNKTIIFFVFTILISVLIYCLFFINNDNLYNPIFKTIKCGSYEKCLHESAHKYDTEKLFISQSKKFKGEILNINNSFSFDITLSNEANYILYVINNFPGIETKRIPDFNPLNITFWTGGWGGYTELYATIVEYSDGDINNIPVSLREFYDMDSINETMKGLGY